MLVNLLSSFRLAHRGGVTTSVTPPSGSGFLQGVSATFRTGAQHALAKGAIVQPETALHLTISYGLPVSVSTQVAALRTLLFGSVRSSDSHDAEQAEAWMQVRKVCTLLPSSTRQHLIPV